MINTSLFLRLVVDNLLSVAFPYLETRLSRLQPQQPASSARSASSTEDTEDNTSHDIKSENRILKLPILSIFC